MVCLNEVKNPHFKKREETNVDPVKNSQPRTVLVPIARDLDAITHVVIVVHFGSATTKSRNTRSF